MIQLAHTILGKAMGAPCTFEGDLDKGVRVVNHRIGICDNASVAYVFIHVIFPSLVLGPLIDHYPVSLAQG
jgi:hypothetical protein